MSQQNDIDAINALYTDWREAVEGGSIPGYLACLDPDIRMMAPGAPDVHGIGNYEVFLGPVFDGASYKIEQRGDINIEVIGDMAIARYDYVIRVNLFGQSDDITSDGALTSAVNDMRYFDTLRRQADGSWKCYTHIWNDNPAD